MQTVDMNQFSVCKKSKNRSPQYKVIHIGFLFFQLTSASPSGLHINITNSEGFSPLHVAAMYGHVTLVELFLKRGANVDARSSKRECTALHLACQNNRQFTHKVSQVKTCDYRPFEVEFAPCFAISCTLNYVAWSCHFHHLSGIVCAC